MATNPLDEEAIFHLARKIDGREVRDAYLRQACGTDEALRVRVEALLHVHDEERDDRQSDGDDRLVIREIQRQHKVGP